MRNIIIIDAFSTGYNYVEDVVRRGYNPIIMNTRQEKESEVVGYREIYKTLYHRPLIIDEQESYEETVKLAKSYDPVIIVPGSETAVVLATRLAYDLGLPGNDVKYLDAMTKKDAMHNALKDAGIRYIHGEMVSSVEEALSFCRDNGFETAVVKPTQSAGSQGIFLCDNMDEVSHAVSALLTMKDIYGRPIEKVLVQERIFGTEYIVNTMSCKGVHRLNSVFRYKKEKTPEGGYIYDYCESIDSLEPGHNRLVEYALKVADAIHYRYGSIHGEYMVDQKGPVLIEVNCRPMGATMPGEFLDMITGQHETDSSLDCYLDPEKFRIDAAKPYRHFRKSYVKIVIVPKDMEVDDHPIWEVAKRLRSTYKIAAGDPDGVRYYPKTRDLESNGGVIYMVHDDKEVVESDIKILRQVEREYFELLLNDGTSRRWVKDTGVKPVSPEDIIKEYGCCGAILVAADEYREIEGAQCITPDSVGDAHKGFDYVVIGYGESLLQMRETDCLKLIFDTMDLARQGGKVIIPKSTYSYLSYGREGAESLMYIKGLMVEVPVTGDDRWVAGTDVGL
ncbi:MAG: ATP-grasp domain-containing protein [Lachnospiraceae bacterium]|nr:ATP-grasp domain-containing protein [Lachnospiraceae bacterium]